MLSIKEMPKLWLLVLLICTGQRTISCEDSLITNSLTDGISRSVKKPKQDPESTTSTSPTQEQTNLSNELGGIALTTIAVSSGLLTIFDAFERRVLPQPTTAQDTLEIVRRLEDLARPNDENEYKHAEDTISRALHDMNVMTTGNASEFQRLLWLERTRLIDNEVVLLQEGLLGQQITGVDLLQNIKENLKCDAIKIREKVNRYRVLIEGGSIAFLHFAALGEMTAFELGRRQTAFRDRNSKILQRNEDLVEECFQTLLSESIREEDPEATTENIAERVAQIMSEVYPLPTRWIVAVYSDERRQQMNPELNQISRAAIKPMKPKHSAEYHIKNINGYQVALFPFLDGATPKMIDGRRVDAFCSQPIRGAGQMPTCDVGSSDGEFVYDELRRLRIIPDPLELIVVPSEGQLSVRSVPLGGLPPFFAKNYPDFHIIAF